MQAPTFPRRQRSRATAGGTIEQMMLLATLCVLAGCSSTIDNDIRVTPSTSIDASRIAGTNITSYGDIHFPAGIRLYNIDPNGAFVPASGMEALKPDLYVTLDVSPIVNAALAGNIDQATRNNLVSFMLYLSDRNADVWESRIYARYKVRKGTVGALRDLATIGAGASALIIPPVAAGLSAANMVVAPLSDQLDTTLYSQDTVETIIKAIAASRHTYKNTIRMHYTNDIPDYDMFFALDQLRHYDSLVSFRKGLAYSASLADKQTDTQDVIANTNVTNVKESEAANKNP